MKKANLSEWALTHQSMVIYLMCVLMVGGVFAYLKLGRKEDPDFTFKAMLVQVNWPGATARDMEQQVTDPVEKKLQSMPEIDFVRSYTKPGQTVMLLNLREDVPSGQVPGLWYQVRKRLGDIRQTLPSGVQGPFYNDEFGDTFGNMYAFTADGFTPEELRRQVETVRAEILRLPDVAKVDFVGEQTPQINVDLSVSKLAALHMDARAIWGALEAQNSVNPSGEYQTPTDRIPVRPDGAFRSIGDIAATPVSAGSGSFRLGDIARLSRAYAEPATTGMRFNGKPALGLAISMKNGGDVLRMGRDLQALMTRLHKDLPVGIEVHAISDQPKVVDHSISEFMHSLAEAVIIVLAVSFVSLGLRPGIVVALSIPLVLAMTFLAMYFFGIDLQRISLGSLIIALGLLVDDAIIAVEMMQLKLEQGWSRFKAGTFAYTSTAFPMLTGTLITAATFLPVGMARSTTGEYVFSLFAVVGIALVLSWVVAVIFTPWLGFRLLKENGGHAQGGHHDVYDKPFYQRFRRLVAWCLHHRKTVIALTLLAFAGSLLLFRLGVAQQFFPSSNRPELMVDMWLPQGAPLEAAADEVRKVEATLRKDPDVESVTAYLGSGSPRFYLPLDQQQQHMNYAQLMVMTRDEHVRENVKKRLETLFAERMPMVRGRVTRLENGPPVGYPVQFRISGPDHDKVRSIAARAEAILRGTPSLVHVNNDWGEQIKSLKIEIDQDKARTLGISTRDIAAQLQMLLSGTPVTQYREGDRNIAVVVRLDAGERRDPGQLGQLMIQTGSGRYVPLSQLGHVRYAPEDSIIWRYNRMPTVTVRADAVDGVQGTDIALRLEPAMQALEATLPTGYHIELGGALESSGKAQASIAAVVPLMIVLVLTLLMLQLQSFQRTLMVVLTAPLGMIGVTLALVAFSAPFGFVAMLGVIALAGMIMRNSVILVDQIEHDRREGIPAWEAVIGSTVRRFRPIMLTALAAILAMIPLVRSTFWGPMAVAIMGGLLVATLLTLLFLPALYAQWFNVQPDPTKDMK